MAMQCADVTKMLGSVYRTNQGGNAVVLDGINSYMARKKTGKNTKNGQYIMNTWIWEGRSAETGISCSNRFECLGESGQVESGPMGFMLPDDAW